MKQGAYKDSSSEDKAVTWHLWSKTVSPAPSKSQTTRDLEELLESRSGHLK